ncbi:MAG: arsenite methyltransferase [Anaerolineae bacterium]|nr:arsenite methyltransferase [Anaerolineae bacterium]
MSDSPQTIYDILRARYGAIAENTEPSCCTPQTQTAQPIRLYDSATLAGLPVDVTSLSLGCGDPVSIADLREGEIVLDLGSGGGIDCFLAARQVGPTGYVIGLDMTPAMLERANTNKAQLGVENVEFRQGQIEAMPIDSDSVDVIMSNCVINLSPDKAAVFAEAFRVLKPGGRISISDIVTEGHFTLEQRADLNQWAVCATGALDAQDYLALITAAGFIDVQIVDKVDADGIITRQPNMPRIYSARVTARKPL